MNSRMTKDIQDTNKRRVVRVRVLEAIEDFENSRFDQRLMWIDAIRSESACSWLVSKEGK
jgi:hypothetical protein